MRLRRLAIAAAGLLALAPVLTACGDNGGDVKVGDIIPARTDAQFVQGTASSIALPIGRLEIFLGTPSPKISADDTRERAALSAPEGATFVPITWQYDAATFGDLDDFIGTTNNPTIDLISDKARYRLPAPELSGEGSRSFYVPVSGAAAAPTLAVTYDGVTQTVDLTSGERDEGPAAPLYRLEVPKKQRSCAGAADFHGAPGVADYECSFTRPFRLPYADGHWTENGRQFVATTVTTTLRRYDMVDLETRSGGIYIASKVRSTFRLGDAKAIMAVEDGIVCVNQGGKGCRARYHVVFDLPAKRRINAQQLTVDQTYQLTLASEYGAFDGRKKERLTVTAGGAPN